MAFPCHPFSCLSNVPPHPLMMLAFRAPPALPGAPPPPITSPIRSVAPYRRRLSLRFSLVHRTPTHLTSLPSFRARPGGRPFCWQACPAARGLLMYVSVLRGWLDLPSCLSCSAQHLLCSLPCWLPARQSALPANTCVYVYPPLPRIPPLPSHPGGGRLSAPFCSRGTPTTPHHPIMPDSLPRDALRRAQSPPSLSRVCHW